MSQFILRYGGSSSIPEDHLESIRTVPGLKVLDQSPKMLLVDGDESTLREKLRDKPGWSIHTQSAYPLPDTRQKIG
jgi:hypothetical protein